METCVNSENNNSKHMSSKK